MKSNLSQFLAVVFAIISVPAAASAQGDQVSMRLDFVGWGEEISGLTLRSSGGAPFTARAFRYSKPQSYSGPAVVEIYQAGGGAEPAAPLAPEEASKLPPDLKRLLELRQNKPGLVALAALPAGSKRATVLVLPAVGGVYLTRVFDDDPTRLPVGRLRVHNLSPHPLSLRFNGTEARQLPLQGNCVVAPVNQELIYELAYKLEEEWKVQENNIVPVADDEQTQMVVLKSDSSHFYSSNGSRAGYLQIVFLRRSPREAEEMEISKADREAAAREAQRLNDEMDEAAKPENARKKPSPKPKAKP